MLNNYIQENRDENIIAYSGFIRECKVIGVSLVIYLTGKVCNFIISKRYKTFKRFDFWYSYVPFEYTRVTHYLKLSIENLCQWLDTPIFQMNNILAWQNNTKVLLKYFYFDCDKNKVNLKLLFLLKVFLALSTA